MTPPHEPPVVTVSASEPAKGLSETKIDMVTAAGFDIIMTFDQSKAVPVHWQAVQMTTADAEG